MEQIYTIPINEAFEESIAKPETGCPFCKLYKMLEDNELELILGASMMEPEIRQKTNKAGFCPDHFKKMLVFGKNKLPLALILESHLDTIGENIGTSWLLPAVKSSKNAKALDGVSSSCYVCEKLENNFQTMLNNAVYLWQTDSSFRKKCLSQPHFCIKHYGMFLKAAKALKRSEFAAFAKALSPMETKHLKELRDSISSFIKQFDYRFENESEDKEKAKRAIENAIESLNGEKL